ncbi:hypothetical protein QMA09_16645 [Planococcus sp. APC 3906]|uniref:hypothetical protein n=1 Tax=Planococcus sp. APC 3906 TaxID=3035194 RepID=UPI0025B349A0|nr:hypothetical protein [Planococcus sp. APC 3906]MDN3451820.1 hypothetical protein [Planococcus sp. APC 3906]
MVPVSIDYYKSWLMIILIDTPQNYLACRGQDIGRSAKRYRSRALYFLELIQRRRVKGLGKEMAKWNLDHFLCFEASAAMQKQKGFSNKTGVLSRLIAGAMPKAVEAVLVRIIFILDKAKNHKKIESSKRGASHGSHFSER